MWQLLRRGALRHMACFEKRVFEREEATLLPVLYWRIVFLYSGKSGVLRAMGHIAALGALYSLYAAA